jgi:hypothetical protein
LLQKEKKDPIKKITEEKIRKNNRNFGDPTKKHETFF